MPKLSIEDKKFLVDQLYKERVAAAMEAILLQVIVFGIFVFLNMTGVSSRFAVSIGLIFVILFVFTLAYSIITFFKNKKRLKEILKIEKSID